MKKYEDKYKSSIAPIPVVTWTLDDKGNIMFVSPNVEQVFGFTQEEMCKIGDRLWLERVHPEDAGPVKEARKALFEKDKMFDSEYRIQKKNGSWIWLRDTVVGTYEKDGVKYADGILLDVTDRRMVAQLKDEFIGIVSHELRTPITIVKEGIGLILDKVIGNITKEQEELLTTAKQNIERLTHIMNNLFDMAQIQEGLVELNIHQFDLIGLVKKITLSSEVLVKDKGLGLKIDCPDKEVSIYADSERIAQIMAHLMENAIKFTEKGHIEISVIDKEEEVECAVRDTGAGIPEDELPRAFDKFQQIGRVEGGGEKGTGTGLAVIKGLVEMHNGKIKIESKLGKGTKVTFTLPKYTTAALFYVEKGIKNARKKDSQISIIVVSIPEFSELKKKLTAGKIQSVLQDMENTLNNCLYRAGDIAVRHKDELVVLLQNCSKENSVIVENRLKHALADYLGKAKIADTFKLKFGHSTYPGEAESAEKLIAKAEK